MKTIRDALGGVHRADAVVSVVPEYDDDGLVLRAEVGIVLTNGHAYTIFRVQSEDRQHVRDAAARAVADVCCTCGWVE